ncbi:MAG: AAA family ATPase, partial [Nannocystaceae bacterium]|nr:AAA family ATPase [Nannocystaceae bacterium]
MRLRSLEVVDFGAVERASVSFGDGLNVLHGPNDLGKSTLAAAIRAALLLQHGSSAARSYIPWGTTRKPTVTLVLEIKGRWWRVHKAFGTSAGGKSVLEWSNDGVTYSLEEEGRGVDGRLRDLLEWGLAAPGGRGGSHGFPKSFLATVLLGEQAMPYRLLEQSLESDAEDTGKARLVEALQAMATDPLYQQVLEHAQTRVDEAFTAKGKRSTRKGSPFERVGAEIKQRRAASEQLIAAVAESDAVVSRLGELSQRRDGTLTERAARAKAMESIDTALKEASVRVGLQAEVDGARAALAEIERNGQEIARLHAELQAARAVVPTVEGELEAERVTVRTAEVECERARAAAEALSSGEDPQQRAQAQARAEAQRTLEAESEALQAREAQLTAWRATCEERDEAVAQRTQAVAGHAKTLQIQSKAEVQGQAAAAAHRRRAEALRWMRAEGLRARVETLLGREAAAGRARAEADAKRAQAASLDVQLSADFPDAKSREVMDVSWRALQMRDAALGGGVRVGLALSQGVSAATDGADPGPVAADATIDADQEVLLDLGALGQVTVRSGDPAAHVALDEAKAAWGVHAARLEGLGLASIEALREAAGAREDLQRQRDARLQEAQMLEARAAPPEAHELQVAKNDVEAAERGLEGVDAAVCKAEVEVHGDDLDAAARDAEVESERLSRLVATAATATFEAQTERRLAEQRADAASKQEAATRPDGDDPLAAAQTLRTALLSIEQRRADLDAQARAEVDGVAQRTEAAKQAVWDAVSYTHLTLPT